MANKTRLSFSWIFNHDKQPVSLKIVGLTCEEVRMVTCASSHTDHRCKTKVRVIGWSFMVMAIATSSATVIVTSGAQLQYLQYPIRILGKWFTCNSFWNSNDKTSERMSRSLRRIASETLGEKTTIPEWILKFCHWFGHSAAARLWKEFCLRETKLQRGKGMRGQRGDNATRDLHTMVIQMGKKWRLGWDGNPPPLSPNRGCFLI